MGEVIDLRKRLMWRKFKQAIESGRIAMRPVPHIPDLGPTTDMGIALAYALAGARAALFGERHDPR